MLRNEEKNQKAYKFICLVLTIIAYTIGIVKYEPAFVDLCLISLIFIVAIEKPNINSFHYQKAIRCIALIALIAMLTSTIILIQKIVTEPAAIDFNVSLKFITLRLYAFGVFCAFSKISFVYGENAIRRFLMFMLISTSLTVILSVLSLMTGLALPLFDLTLDRMRIQGFFKDPNVFGPFCVCTLCCSFGATYQFISKKWIIYWNAMLVVCATGAFLSFSRATWMYLIIVLIWIAFEYQGDRKRLIALSILSCLIIICSIQLQNPGLIELAISRSQLQGYDNQRFSNQANSINLMISNPLGIGLGQSERLLGMSTHQTYIRYITEQGTMAVILPCFVSALIFLKIRQQCLFQNRLIRALCVNTLGISLVSPFVDVLHWRHLWIIGGILLGLLFHHESIVEK